MRIVRHKGYTEIFLDKEEVMRLCRPGEMENTCVWLAAGTEGFECLYYNRRGVNLVGEPLEERYLRGLTNAKRDGCDEARALAGCANYLNQKAIDKIVRKHNEELGEQLYHEGRNCCHECANAPGASLLDDPVMTDFRMMGAESAHRICYVPANKMIKL